jgi:F-type H+-transporting ATPase subunit b
MLYWFAYQPVLRMLEKRREQIALGVANTEKINAALAGIEAQRQKVIADAHAQGQQFLAEAREAAKRLQEQEARRTVVATQQIMARAQENAAAEHARMLIELRREVGRLVVQTTAAVVGKVLTPDDQRRLTEETTKHLSA